MILKGELYTGHHFLTKVSIYRTDESSTLSIVPRNRSEFIIFYPSELLTIHHMDEEGHLHFYDVQFLEIKMIKTTVYYQFTIQAETIYENMKNKVRQSNNVVALMTDFQHYYPVIIETISKDYIEMPNNTPNLPHHIGFLFYLGKKKVYTVTENSFNETTDSCSVKRLAIQQKIHY